MTVKELKTYKELEKSLAILQMRISSHAQSSHDSYLMDLSEQMVDMIETANNILYK